MPQNEKWNRRLIYKMRNIQKKKTTTTTKKNSGHERHPELICVEKPEAKLLIWINIQHQSSGFGVDVGNEELAIFAKICDSNSVHGHLLL